MAWRFWTDPNNGLIWTHAGDDRKGFTEALSDSVSSLSPRGEPPNLSTYWIDRALERLRLPSSDDEVVVSGGNATQIFRKGQRVRAVSLYDVFDDEWMDVDEFERGLQGWRAEGLEALQLGRTLARDQSNYQRNPWP